MVAERDPLPVTLGGMTGVGRHALVTGAAGFVGQWLSGALLQGGWSVSGVALAPLEHSVVLTDDERAAITWHQADVRDGAALGAALDATPPDAIFHLAGISYVPAADADPGDACDVNATAAARLLAAVAARRAAGTMDPSVIVVGSAEQYGRQPDTRMPLPETADQCPLTVYAATKAAQEVYALQTWRRDGLRVVATRPFNHTGRGQSERFLVPALVRRALDLRSAGGQALSIGNVTPIRDIAHVSDVVRAYILLADLGEPGSAYNVCTGVGHSVGEIAARVLGRVGVDARLAPADEHARAVDVPVLIGSPAKLTAGTGWMPARTLDDCIDDLIHAATH